jgi:hypothetical protein
MKFALICFTFAVSVALTHAAMAQTMGIKDIPTNGDTTIKIQKGATADSEYQITTGTEEIEGEAANLLKEARANWRTACSDWKKETKELNKENQVLALNCGSMKCASNEMETTCRSEGTHKLRVKIK